MATPLKDMYSEPFLQELGRLIQTVYNQFNTKEFIAEITDDTWESLELKARIRHISQALGRHLPAQYEEALDILLAIDDNCKGFPYLILPDFVEVYGQANKDWDLSMKALEKFTCGSSAEFAVRPFILREPERMMKQMQAWSKHSNEHVRRLASEGCRPRLPWGKALSIFKEDPAPIRPVLEELKDDVSIYVRKSVANNLNDISKDHSDFVLEIVKEWKGTHADTDWILRHGSRTLIKKANPRVLELFGYANPLGTSPLTTHSIVSTELSRLPIGGSSQLHYELHIREGESVKIRIEYAIDFVKANGKTSRKPFFLSDRIVKGGAVLTGTRTHRWSNLSTRRHYPGEHKITLLINGQEVANTTIFIEDEKE
ncbi:DNA alkylation repair protein [Bacillus solitudinis]|uniref:DNA alkylation repair protein n=1 Tax=Bacillus solitudinis TaxID=2014074 RepID=UPI000C2462FF|nr:DNA alkylation repair protein [Bacillus solitudinis]